MWYNIFFNWRSIMPSVSREYTKRLLEAVENGLTTWENVATSCLDFMSEQDVKDMCEVDFPEVCPDYEEEDDD
jgi:hypothetical protein